MMGEKQRARVAWALAVLITLALILSLLLPLVASAQETAGGAAATGVLAEAPTTGGGRLGPVAAAGSRVGAPAPEPEPVAGVAPPVERGAVVDGAMRDPSGPRVVAW